MYRVYLRRHDQSVPLESKTNADSAAQAAAAFSSLVDRTDLDGQKIAAVLSNNGTQMAFHRFDKPAGDVNHWRGRLDEIEWPVPVIAPGHGGARASTGRKPATTDGGDLKLYSAKLDKTTWEILVAYGDGNFAEGVRRAARALATKKEPRS